MTPDLISIDGIDGSGKSHFGARLLAELDRRGVRALLLRVDDFRRSIDWSRRDEDEGAIYYDEYYDFDQVEACVAAYRAGQPQFVLAPFDSFRGSAGAPVVLPLADVDLVVVEGVFTLRIPAARAGFVVLLETSFDEARRRIVDRDVPRGRSLAEVERRIERRYFPSQRRYLAEYAPRDVADLVIDNEDFRAPRTVRAHLDRLASPVRAAVEALVPRTPD